jgi:hypothetical protein
VSKLLKLYETADSNNYLPATLSAVNNGAGVPTGGGTTYQYTYSNSTNPPAFCITATKSSLSYYTNQDSLISIGGCPGDIVQGSPSITNPSFETDTVGNLSYPAQWNQYGNVGNSYEGVTNDFATYGTKSFKISQASSDMDGGVWARISGLTIGQDVSVSAHIKSGSGVANASLVLCTGQHGLTGSQTENANQNENVDGRFTATINNIDQTAVDVFLGQGSFGSSSRGDVWFDGLQVTVE